MDDVVPTAQKKSNESGGQVSEGAYNETSDGSTHTGDFGMTKTSAVAVQNEEIVEAAPFGISSIEEVRC